MFSERNYEHLDRFSPYIIENGGTLPARLSQAEMSAMDDVISRCAILLGVDNGPLKGDIVLTENGPVVLEMAPRLGGGYAATDSIPLTTGVELTKQVIRLCLNEDIKVDELKPRPIQTAVLRFFFPQPGKISSIKGFEGLSGYDWVKKRGMYLGVGDTVEPVTNHCRRAGFVIVAGKDEDEAKERASRAVNSVKIETI